MGRFLKEVIMGRGWEHGLSKEMAQERQAWLRGLEQTQELCLGA